MDDAASSSSISSYKDGKPNALINKIYKLLAHDNEIVSSEHIAAVDALETLQSSLEHGGEASKTGQIRLVCVLSSLHRRGVRLQETIARVLHYGDSSSKSVQGLREEFSFFKRTATLAFVVVAMFDLIALGGSAEDKDVHAHIVDEHSNKSLWDCLSKRPKRRLEPPEELQFNEKQKLLLEQIVDLPFCTDESSSSWHWQLSCPGSIAKSAVRCAGGVLCDGNERDSLEILSELEDVFTFQTSEQMKVGLLKTRTDFGSLSAQSILSLDADAREEACCTLADAADSEAGQAVLRDLVISFLMPAREIGRRRTLLLDRTTSSRVSKHFPWIASLSHEAAMVGAPELYRTSKSELLKTCALIAGVAMLTTNGTDDVARKATAFSGLVQLPFFETISPPPKRARIALVPATRSWALYTISPRGIPVVEVSAKGFEGLVLVLLTFNKS